MRAQTLLAAAALACALEASLAFSPASSVVTSTPSLRLGKGAQHLSCRSARGATDWRMQQDPSQPPKPTTGFKKLGAALKQKYDDNPIQTVFTLLLLGLTQPFALIFGFQVYTGLVEATLGPRPEGMLPP
eukprot:CAMPEP_0173389772 /NCGR_PEP_ID=MMETSP1356-20130122/13402_1 /TAXON_ID=77927 ORGANISM="Hemiselmis virescens, Strain PCC157" /NCGR_SAMPLE_ID=MMETSP1356 /ASSEMBLY_ACC=CAM_ASM_000847 /LENGTH=129 /DNA_ID=CAMNT_0014347017 /DNA_START=85 /DNA_END=474 /DNA_ORIENTATION=-